MTNQPDLWQRTLNRGQALTNHYLGEQHIRPRLATNAVKHALGRRLVRPIVMYYYVVGKPADALLAQFEVFMEEQSGA